MNALSQISQITQLAVELGAGCEHHLQACIDALLLHKQLISRPYSACDKCGCDTYSAERPKEGWGLCNDGKDDTKDYYFCGVCAGEWRTAKANKIDLHDWVKGTYAVMTAVFKVKGKTFKVKKTVEMGECVVCEKKVPKDALIEGENTDCLYCEGCYDDTYIKCEMCCYEVDKEDGEWVSVSHNQPFLKKVCNSEYCWDCFTDNIDEAFLPEYKTDTFTFQPEGDLRNDDITSYAERHAEAVAEMEWCERCDICPQEYTKNETYIRLKENNWCAECYFQHGADDNEE
jgi:hypothetical protein